MGGPPFDRIISKLDETIAESLGVCQMHSRRPFTLYDRKTQIVDQPSHLREFEGNSIKTDLWQCSKHEEI